MRRILYLLFRYFSVAGEVDYLAIRFDYFRTHIRYNVHGWTKPPAMHFLWFREATPMVEPLHTIVPFVFHKWGYICGLTRQEGLGHFPWSLYMSRAVCDFINASSSMKWSHCLEGEKLFIIFCPDPRLSSLIAPSAMICQGGVWLGLFYVTAELPRLF